MESLIKVQIADSAKRLYLKLNDLNFNNLAISEYNKVYLKKYIDNFPFYISLYSQLLKKAIKKLNKPVSESVFVDYGGGCGILSYLAKEVGFKTVVYNDNYQISLNDTQIISGALGISIDHYICGDVEDFVNEVSLLGISPDLICSFDVLEHIYNIEKWFKTIIEINNSFSLLFMTSANSCNPFVVRRLERLQIQAEHEGLKRTAGWKEIDLNNSFLEARGKIIKEKFPDFNKDIISELATKTRGLRKDDIIKVVNRYIETSEISYQIEHPTNTCDPYTGNWTEKLFDLKQLTTLINNNKLSVDITNSYYSYSHNNILNLPKFILNILIKIVGKKILFFSPTFTLEIVKN